MPVTRLPVLLALLPLALPPAAAAQQDDALLRDHYRQAYAGWSGLVLHCTGEGPLAVAVCEGVESEVAYLAAGAGVELALAENYRAATVEQVENGRLQLTVEVTTRAVEDFGLVSAAVRAEAGYRGATEAEAASGDPRAAPRAGSLVFWHDGAAGAGPGTASVEGVLEALGGSLRRFFTSFVAARR